MLSLRATFKQEIKCTHADLVYGSLLRLPGEFFDPTSPSPRPDTSEYVVQLRSALRNLRVLHPRPQHRDSPYIPPDLETATHMFVRRDAVRKPLQRPHDGPYRIIKCNDKVYTLDLHGRHDTFSIDFLKAAIVEDTLPHTISDLLRCIR